MPRGIYKRIKPVWNKGKSLSEEHIKHLKENHKGMLGKHFSKEAKEKMRKAENPYHYKEGNNPWNKGKKIQSNTGRTWFRKGQNKKEKNTNWKGGYTPEYIKIRTSIEGKLWRKSVFQRDNFTCQKYKIRGGELVAHHINNFVDFPELRFSIDNGITLSKKAHDEFHKIYGKRNNTKEQLDEFFDD